MSRKPSKAPLSLTPASLLAVALLCVLDFLRGPLNVGPTFIVTLAGLAVTAALILGGVLQWLLTQLPRVPLVGAGLLFLTPVTAFGWVAFKLGVLDRLSGRYQLLALGTAGACAAAGLLMGGLLLGLRDRRDGQPGRLRQLGAVGTVTLGFGLLIAGLLAQVLDQKLYVGLYPNAHFALRLSTAILWTLALAVFRPWPPLGDRAQPTLVLAILLSVTLLTSNAHDALQAFARRPFAGSLLRGARMTLDWDRDGFSALLGGGDCDDLNPAIHPSAPEIPDNGIDDNCAFGDAVRKPPPPTAVPEATVPSPLSVVLITVDTLRWDRLPNNDPDFGPAGFDTMPNLARWAAEGRNFTRAYSAGSWTSIAITSLFRGVYARRLSWVPYYETNRFRMLRSHAVDHLTKRERIEKMFPVGFSDARSPLPFWLQRRGMTTAAVVDDSFSLMLSKQVGANSGFSSYRQINTGARLRPTRGDADTARAALQELKRLQRAKRPFFLWVHFFGPHGPSMRHKGVRLDGDGELNYYDHEVRYLDSQLGPVLDALRPTLDKTAVFVTSDHGEELSRHFRNHGASVRETLIRIPLVAHVPGWGRGTYAGPVSHIDLMPTILNLTKTPAPRGLDGLDLGPLLRDADRPKARILLADSWAFERFGRPYHDHVAAFDGTHKLVLDRRDHSFSRQLQAGMQDTPSRDQQMLRGPLMNALMGYLEETGGAVRLSEPPRSP